MVRIFRVLASIYANAHTSMHRSAEFTGGITNGAQWYTLYGGMQDWNYEALGCMELTLEVSNTKYPQVDSLDSYWIENLPAMLAYLEQVHTGLVGTVEDKTRTTTFSSHFCGWKCEKGINRSKAWRLLQIACYWNLQCNSNIRWLPFTNKRSDNPKSATIFSGKT